MLRTQWLHSEINIKGIKLTTEKIIVRLIDFLAESHNDAHLTNVTSAARICPEIKNYLENFGNQELHVLKCDIQRCYDSLSFRKVMTKIEREIWDFADSGQAPKIYFTFETAARKFGRYETLVSKNWRFSAKERDVVFLYQIP